MLMRFMFLLAILMVIFTGGISENNPVSGQAGTLQRITTGDRGEGGGSYAVISGDGSVVIFESPANDFSDQHISGSWDVYAHDTPTGDKQLVSVDSAGDPVENSGDYTSPPSVSANGRIVAFVSQAADLSANDQNGVPDIFVHDRETGITELISANPQGQSGAGPSFTPAISANGRFVVFQSLASDLVAGDTNDSIDIFVRDRQTGQTERVSVNSSGQQGSDPNEYGFSSVAVTSDGRYAAFSYQSLPGQPSVDGPIVYVRDRQTATTHPVAPGSYPALTPDGRYMAFVSPVALVGGDQNDTDDIYLIDTQTISLALITPGQADSESAIYSPPDLSADGNLIVFETTAGLDPADQNEVSDIYLHNRGNAATFLISVTPTGQAGNGESHEAGIDDAGTQVVFSSFATDLIAGDANGRSDIFLTSLNLNQAGLTDLALSYYIPYITSE